ncbi:MAG: hypothetical protein US31_C0004G0007 [Berkelbacteria bacterium GW2011_GWA1_36_9]|uniref:Uncharacterized protein n=1 Tax=Berkelbacteria bacterium GW2011_GWA1_36_9 TaxID=1618331 RepID=A0A0G0FX93_9BACT|nr:MAG: hypothetical protein US31_C0004G0007 [Berkelbacteria bacterium GW2011_GWA1_36_9]
MRYFRSSITIWILIIAAIFWTDIYTWLTIETTLPFGPLNPFFHNFGKLYIDYTKLFYGTIYGWQYLANKFFLVVVAFLVLGYWLFRNPKVLKSIRPNLIYLAVISLSLLMARIFTFEGWFFHDDFRMITAIFNRSPIGILYPQYPVGILYLVADWFGGNYYLYNTLGLLGYFVSGTMIFAIGNILQKKKYVSLLAAIFFVTTPTYLQEKLLIENMIGDGLIMLLFLISFYLLLRNFISGSVIFAAAALEFGVARTQFIAAPLILAGLFFLPKILKQKKKIILLLFFPAISLAYLPVLFTHHSITRNEYNINHIINIFKVFGDMLSSITVPFAFNYSIVYGLAILLHKWQYITIALGYLIIFLVLLSSFILYLKKKFLAAKLLFLGFIIITTATFPAVIAGVRVDRAVDKFVDYNLSSLLGSNMGTRTATAYGFFPSIGLVLVAIGLGTLLKPKLFKIILSAIIVINIISSVYLDWNWAEYWGRHNQKMVTQLEKILPKEEKTQYVYVSSKQRFLWQGVKNFQEIFRANQKITTLQSAKDFSKEILKVQPSPNQLYFLVEDWSYNIYDYSGNLRELSQEQLNSRETLINILTALDNNSIQKHYPKQP